MCRASKFIAYSERILSEQQAITKRKVELETILETQKDTEDQFHAFLKQIALFTHLDIDGEQVLTTAYNQRV